MNSIVTKIGVFEVRECVNNKSFTEVFSNGKSLGLVKAPWWDKDSLAAAIEDVSDAINEKLNEDVNALKKHIEILENEQNKVNVNEKNVLEVLQLANAVLKENITDAKDRGFVCSRLSQIVNKLQAT